MDQITEWMDRAVNNMYYVDMLDYYFLGYVQ